MTFTEHLEELRQRIFICLFAVGVTSFICWFVSPRILSLLMRPGDVVSFQTISPTEMFFSRLKVAVVSGIFFSTPLLFYQAWLFVSPALRKIEKKVVFYIVVFSSFFLLQELYSVL
jgi:sec-independent protein translocase protein TatC